MFFQYSGFGFLYQRGDSLKAKPNKHFTGPHFTEFFNLGSNVRGNKITTEASHKKI